MYLFLFNYKCVYHCDLSTPSSEYVQSNIKSFNTFKYHVFAPMAKFQLEFFYLYFPPSSHLIYVCFFLQTLRCYNNIINRSCRCSVLQDRNIHILDGTTVENKGKIILTKIKRLIWLADTWKDCAQSTAIFVLRLKENARKSSNMKFAFLNKECQHSI